MNWIDILILISAGIGLLVGWKVGLLGAIFNAIGLLVGVFIAARFSDDIAAWFTEQGAADAIATVLSYVVIIIGVLVGAQIAKGTGKKMLSLVFLGWVDTIGSIAVGLLCGLVLSGAVILALTRYSNDLPEGAISTIVEMTGIRGSVQNAMVESSLIPLFIDITDAIPADTLGFIPGDFKLALQQMELLLES